MTTTTLQDLQLSANGMRIPSTITNTGGGVMALTFTIDGRHALLALDYGHMSGESWAIALDGETREEFGEDESADLPVTDPDQVMRNAIAWVRAIVAGTDPYADGNI